MSQRIVAVKTVTESEVVHNWGRWTRYSRVVEYILRSRKGWLKSGPAKHLIHHIDRHHRPDGWQRPGVVRCTVKCGG